MVHHYRAGYALKRLIGLYCSLALMAVLPPAVQAQPEQTRGKSSVNAASKQKHKIPQPIRKVAAKTLQAPIKARKVSAEVAPRPSYGQLAGLHAVSDELALKSSVAYVVDQDTQEVLFRDRKSTRLNSSHTDISRMPSSA